MFATAFLGLGGFGTLVEVAMVVGCINRRFSIQQLNIHASYINAQYHRRLPVASVCRWPLIIVLLVMTPLVVGLYGTGFWFALR